MTTTAEAKMIARRAKKGYTLADSQALLAEIIEAHEGDNLVVALVYNEFATEAQATRYAEAAA